MNFRLILPDGSRGIDATISIVLGTLKGGKCSKHQALMSSFRTSSEATTSALMDSPHTGCRDLHTTTSDTPVNRSMTVSTSDGRTLSPETLIKSSIRPKT